MTGPTLAMDGNMANKESKHGDVSIEFFPASVGDSILIRCFSRDDTLNILVDGGVKETYKNQIESRLQNLKSEGQKLDLVVITHIDTDHIGGILELL